MTKVKQRINDEGWLQMVRQDLDSKAEDWAVKTKVGDIGKLEAVCHYLDAILTELDWPSSIHDCPMCGNRHRGDGLRSDAPPKASKPGVCSICQHRHPRGTACCTLCHYTSVRR